MNDAMEISRTGYFKTSDILLLVLHFAQTKIFELNISQNAFVLPIDILNFMNKHKTVLYMEHREYGNRNPLENIPSVT